jgi:hypothetical protein
MKPGRLAALLLLYIALSAVPASADVFLGDVHTTVTVSDTHYWSGIDVADGQTLEYTVKVQSGDVVNVHLMDDSKLALFLLGSTVTTVHSDDDTTSSTYSHSTVGKYALVIDNGLGTSVCKVDIVVRSAGFWETGTGCLVIGVVIFIIIIAVAAVVVMRLRRRRPSQAQQYGAPQPQYGGPGYPVPSQQYPAQTQYPPAAQQYPAPAPPQYPAQPPAGYPAQYSPPPAPPEIGTPPARPPQPPAAPSAPGASVQCKYCDLQMPAGTQICPRCGGFN